MSATSSTGEEAVGPDAAAASTATPAPTGQSLIGSQIAPDRCSVCDAELAPDQRYCVDCGTRRGRARFSLAATTATGTRSESAAARAPERSQAMAPSVMIATAIITLLLALGIGILIGQSIAPTVHVTVGGSVPAASGRGGSSAPRSTPATSSPDAAGSTCKAGTPGCQHGKQTGKNLFGP